MMHASIYEFVKEQENDFETQEIKVSDNWNWSFRKHVQLIFHLKNGIFFTGENDWMRAFKNIMEPILNLAYWAEDIEVKDVFFYIEEKAGRVLSFLVKKYHDEVFVKENNLDTLFDQIAESDIDYGGVLVQKNDSPCPEVIKLKRIAFCDQTDILGGPIAFKHNFSPSKLRGMKKYGWGSNKNGANISIEDLIVLADNNRTPAGMAGNPNKTTGKTIEVYIIRGNLPEHYLKDDNNMEDYCCQLQIIALYTDKDNKRNGVTLYRKEDEEDSLMFHTSQEVEDRALGRGEGEALLHPQVWTNFLTIHKTNMLEAGSKVPLYTDDPTYSQKNKIRDMENLEITTIEDNKRIYQVPTAAPANIQMLDKAVNEWLEQGQFTGAAFDPILGKEGVSGTTFRGQERSVQQGRGLHDRRKGKRAKFIEEIYRKLIIPRIVKEITKGKKFLATLSSDEMVWVTDALATNAWNRNYIDKVLDQQGFVGGEKEMFIEQFKKDFTKKGNKHLLEILKGEMEGIELRMGINVAGKQKDIVGLSDKLLSIFQAIFANPVGFQQTMQIPGMSKTFESILEFGGINISDFSALLSAPPIQQMQAQQMPQQAQQAQPMLPSPQTV